MNAPGILFPALVAGLLFAAAARAQDAAPLDDVGSSAAAADAPATDGDDELLPRVTTSPASMREGSGAPDELVLERTEITGNRELPKVLYIVPWRKSDPGALVGKPANTLLDEVLAPLDREEFIRQVDYYSDLFGDSGSRAVRAPAALDSASEPSTGARDAGD